MAQLYSYYDPGQEQAKAEQRHQQMVGNLMQMGQSRQRFMDQQYARAEAERQKGLQNQQDANESGFGETASGAAMGASFGGPMGALIGGGIGDLLGSVKSYGARKAKGESTGHAILGALGNFITGGIAPAIGSAEHGNVAPLMAGANVIPGLVGGMVANKFFPKAGPTPVMDDQAAMGNAQADADRWNRQNTVENADAMAAQNPILNTSAENNFGGGKAFSAPAAEDVAGMLRKRRGQGSPGFA